MRQGQRSKQLGRRAQDATAVPPLSGAFACCRLPPPAAASPSLPSSSSTLLLPPQPPLRRVGPGAGPEEAHRALPTTAGAASGLKAPACPRCLHSALHCCPPCRTLASQRPLSAALRPSSPLHSPASMASSCSSAAYRAAALLKPVGASAVQGHRSACAGPCGLPAPAAFLARTHALPRAAPRPPAGMRKLSVVSVEAYDARVAAKVGCRRRPRHVIAPLPPAARLLHACPRPACWPCCSLWHECSTHGDPSAVPSPTAQAATRPVCYSRCASGAIAAVHPAAAAPALADPASFPTLSAGGARLAGPLMGAWARRAAATAAASTATATLNDDAEDVAARPSTAASTPYLLPAKRPGASPALLIGQAYPRPSIDGLLAAQRTSTAPALWVTPQRRTAEQAAAAAAAPRPGCACAWPQLVAGPQLASSSAAPAPRYRLALAAAPAAACSAAPTAAAEQAPAAPCAAVAEQPAAAEQPASGQHPRAACPATRPAAAVLRQLRRTAARQAKACSCRLAASAAPAALRRPPPAQCPAASRRGQQQQRCAQHQPRPRSLCRC